MKANLWAGYSESILITDLGVCLPREALSGKRRHGHWKVLDYKSEGFSGRCVAAGPLTDAPALTLPLNVSGRYAVYLGLGWYYFEKNMIRIKVTGDSACQHRSHQAGQNEIEEVFFKCEDLSGKNLHFAQQSAGFAQACVLMYVRLVPMTEEEILRQAGERQERSAKRLIATIDGQGLLYRRKPTTKEELLEEFENYRDTDFGTIWYGGANLGLTTYTPRAMDDFPGKGYRNCYESICELTRKGIDINHVAVEAAHSLGMNIHISFRPSSWAHPVPFEDYHETFFSEHPEWRCYDKDGAPVSRMSFAVPEVRAYIVELFRKVLEKAAPDGLNILFNRGCSVNRWEEPFCKLFKEKYGEDPREVDDDDPRVYALRAEIMTRFMRELRELLDETQSAKKLPRKVELSAMLLGTEELNRKFGLDAERWVNEGLLDNIGIDWAASEAYSTIDGRAYYDFSYYKRITKGTSVGLYPVFNPIEWESIGDPDKKIKHWHVGDLRERSAEYYDSGADGLMFWDVSLACVDGSLWPIIRRMGHKEALADSVEDGRPEPVTYPIKEWAGVVYGGRSNPWAGG